ncbi:hypothetical protein BJV74DRAFT_246923 [Russula compacta]|nr:hypothetical protein BJV74DRAFT_246923 [Russula compacta]
MAFGRLNTATSGAAVQTPDHPALLPVHSMSSRHRIQRTSLHRLLWQPTQLEDAFPRATASESMDHPVCTLFQLAQRRPPPPPCRHFLACCPLLARILRQLPLINPPSGSHIRRDLAAAPHRSAMAWSPLNRLGATGEFFLVCIQSPPTITLSTYRLPR